MAFPFIAIGLNIHIASPLEQACEPEGIYLAHAAWGLVREEIS